MLSPEWTEFCNHGYITRMSAADAQPAADAENAGAVAFGRILAYFLKLGAIGFGGPIATVGYMQRDLVERRQWMDRRDFLDGVPPSDNPGLIATPSVVT
jgi:hypothetical protein